ncbi:hypothetical protein ABS71_04315 [bacterium SCN 62-11]|nr:MAG: hypothetical protein ABS71_04315 [bacterium SCN 62-11]
MSRLFPEPLSVSGYQTLLGSCSDQELLRVSHGNLIRQYTAVQISNLGPSLAFRLTHNSQDSFLGSMGPSWRHNWMTHLEFGTSLVTYVDDGGRRHNFALDGGDWVLDQGNSMFLRKTLTEVSGQWHLKGFANGDDMVFDSDGRLIEVVDSHSQALSLSYSGDLLTSVEEPTGRQLTFTHASGLLTSVTDPRGHSTQFLYNSDGKLTSIVGPEGCVLSYGYASGATNGLIVSRTDARNQTYSYTYDGSQRLLTLTNPAAQVLTYAYNTVNEQISSLASFESITLDRTTLTDADGAVWDYRFDTAGNLWRILDPLNHNRRFYWSDQQELLYVSEGYGLNQANQLGPLDVPHNKFTRFYYDGLGNMTASIDPNGIINQHEYDEENRVVAVTPARATNQIGGNWFDHFGKDGFVMCSALEDSDDLVQLPSYIDSGGLLAGEVEDGSNAFVRALPNLIGHRIDIRAPWIRLPGSPERETYRRTLGMWKSEEESQSFTFRIPVSETGEFNLSFYTHSADQPYWNETKHGTEQVYAGIFGRDVEFLVTDFDPISGEPRRQSFRLANNAAGCWVTFGVYAEAESFIRVLVRTRASNEESASPVLNVIAFDPIEQRTTNLYYTGVDLTSVVDPLNQTTTMEYNADGTLKKVTDAKSRDTQFFYEDTAKNLTKITDASAGEVVLVYDANGNVTSSEDQDGRVSTMVYDAKNRLVQVTDPLSHSTYFHFDPAGNLVSVQDAKGRQTFLGYDNLNRLHGVSDALGRETFFEYDGTGRVTKVTDALGRESQFAYDAAGRLVETEMADGQKVLYALNAVNRLVSITGPNASQANWDEVNLEGALDVLENGKVDRLIKPGHADVWQHTMESDYDYNPYFGLSNDAHTGNYSLPVNTSLTSQDSGWYLNDVTTYAGGRYLAKAWAKKASGGPATLTARISAQVRNFQADLETQNEPAQATTVDTNWTELKPQIVQIPGDTQAVRTLPSLRRLRFMFDKPGTDTTGYIDDATMQLVNTCMEYDGVNLREVATADGARFRREFDRVGRLCRLSDPQGRVIFLAYDCLDRVIAVSDSLGLTLAYAYDETGQLVSFTDAKNQVMTFAYDDLDRLLTITYPDSTTEEFAYSPAGDLTSYTDNSAAVRTFAYDHAHRLVGVTYPNLDTLVLAYDEVNNLVSRSERNGDSEAYHYDKLNRVTRCVLTPDVGSDSPAWDLTSSYDEVGNRTGLANTGGVRYDTSALYETAHYGQNTPIWSVPEEGFDEMNRLVEFLDSQENSTTFGYDVEGRRTSVSCPNGTLTQATYDIVGKLLSLTTTLDEEELLRLDYGYNLAGDRLAQLSDKASYTYHLDKSGRLVEETINRWVTRQVEHLAQGDMVSCQLDFENGRVQLLGVEDDFQVLNVDRWRPSSSVDRAPTNPAEQRYLGNELRVNDGIHMVYPSTWTAFQYPYILEAAWYGAGSAPRVRCRVGYMGTAYQNLDLRRPLKGDFDVVLEWDGFDLPNGITTSSPDYETYPYWQFLAMRLRRVSGTDIFLRRAFQANTGSAPFYVSANNYIHWSYDGTYDFNEDPTSEPAGKFRMARVGSTLTMYYWDVSGASWQACGSGATVTGDLFLTLNGQCQSGYMNHRLISLSHLGEDPVLFPEAGTYESSLYDAGRTVHWDRISWAEDLETATDVEFQLAFSDDVNGPWSYIGPDGTSATKFTTSAGEDLDDTSDFEGRYARFKAFLSSDGLATPAFGDVHLSFSAEGLLDSEARIYQYDEAGNIEMVTTVTDAGSSTDERTHNDLNQITEQIVGADTWTFSYDDNGNMTGKTDGTDTWIYTWTGDENRLVRVQGPGGIDIAYSYDSMGRMLTRDDGTDLTIFTWDHWDCIKEVTGESETVYNVPEGSILSFVRDGVTYQAHQDALGSIRMITDEVGDVAARYEFSGFGSAISVTEDSTVAEFPYQFIGAAGVRNDAGSGLIYMRKRWYASTLQRFISRDPIGLQGGSNLYRYAKQNPLRFNDPTGLDPEARILQRTSAEIQQIINLRERGLIGSRQAFPKSMDHLRELMLIRQTYERVFQAEKEHGICVFYAGPIFLALRELSRSGRLKYYTPGIWGTVAEDYGNDKLWFDHNFAVLYDRQGEMSAILDPWQTSTLKSDGVKVFTDEEAYRQAHGGVRMESWPEWDILRNIEQDHRCECDPWRNGKPGEHYRSSRQPGGRGPR